MWVHVIRFMPRRIRQARVNALLEQLEAWEADGRDLLAQLVELTDQGDDIHTEVRRVLELLDR